MFRLSKLVLVSLVILVILSTIPSAHAEYWIYYDDGTMDEIGSGLYKKQAAVKFTSPFYCKLLTARMYIEVKDGYPPFKLHVTDADHNDLIPPIEVLHEPPYGWRWLDVDLSTYDIRMDGGLDFYISIEFSVYCESLDGIGACTWTPRFGLDNSSPDGRSYFYHVDAGWQQDCSHDYMIQVEFELPPLPPPPPPPGKREVPEFSLGIPIITSIATIVYLTIKKRASKRR